tara:strand:+ start:307 stop:564 length:258 start_codon:yes stop_codon:yes gene_type:complete
MSDDMKISDDMNKFSQEFQLWLISKNQEYKDPLMMGAVLMKATVELYLSRLSDEDMHNLLDVVAESVAEIRKQNIETHSGSKVIH